MRILFFTDYFWPEPAPPAHHIAERATIWAKKGHQVTLVTNHPNYPDGRIYSGHKNSLRTIEKKDGYRVIRVWTFVAAHQAKLGKLVDHISFALSAFLQALREPIPDVVVASSPHLFVGLTGALYSRMVRKPFLLEIRDLWPDSVIKKGTIPYYFFKKIERFLYRSAQGVAVMTPAFRNHVAKEGAKKVRLIIGGADLRRFRPGKAPDKLLKYCGLRKRFIIMYPGTLGTAHDTDFIIKAASKLKESNARFLFLGNGPCVQKLRRDANRVCPDMIKFIRSKSYEEMPKWWRVADVGLVLLRHTSFMRTVIPSKIFEAMAVGRPILYVGPRGAGASLVKKHKAGVIINNNKLNSFVKSVQKLIKNKNHYGNLSKKAFAASKSFSRLRHAEETLKALNEIRKMDSKKTDD